MDKINKPPYSSEQNYTQDRNEQSSPFTPTLEDDRVEQIYHKKISGPESGPLVLQGKDLSIEQLIEPVHLDSVIETTESLEVKVLLRFLISSINPQMKDLSWKLISSVLLKKDKQHLAECRVIFQKILEEIFIQLKDVPPHSEKENLYEILIADLFTLYPFLEPHYECRDGSIPILTVPQKVGNEWKLIEYEVVPKRLGKEWMNPPLYAYALTPKDKEAHSLLLFMGTPPPTTTGESIAKWVDFIPGHTVGEVLYKMSQHAIEDFVNEEFTKTGRTVKLYGKSLGGALCLITSAHCGPKVEANAFNPPGLDRNLYKLYKENLEKWMEGDGKPPIINVFSQKNDPVSELIGKFPKETNFYQIAPEQQENGYYAHIKTFAGGKKITVIKLNPAELNKQLKRKIFTIAFHVFSCVMIIFNTLALLFSSVKYAFLKSCKAIVRQKPKGMKKPNIQSLG